ncbi:MAG: thioredoxin family protein [Deltaproteobacteria bacterium]|nr:thioredoxin family protein [Deltaproteobacteria bacterium]
MRRCIIAFLLGGVLACQNGMKPATSPELNWLDEWETAETQSKKTGTPLLIEFSTEWCPYCRYIDERIFPDPEVVTRLERFVRVRFDGDKGSVQPLMERFHIQGFPTFLVMAPDGAELARFNDINVPQQLMDLLDQALAASPGLKELTLARSLEDRGENEAALAQYRTAATMLKEKNNPAREDALRGVANLLDEDRDAKVSLFRELIAEFPESAWIPSYYNELVDVFQSGALKREYRQKAAAVIEDRLRRFAKLPQDVARVTLGEHITLLADLYGDLNRHHDIRPLYLRAAEKCRNLIDAHGGVVANRHLIGDISFYYRRAGEPKRAISFLKQALKQLSDYWPVSTGYSLALFDLGDYVHAAEWAERGYAQAEEVARPKVAFIWAEIEAAAHHYDEARAILERARDDLVATGASESGRGKKVMAKLVTTIDEYRLAEGGQTANASL